MASREECITAINNFIKTQDLTLIITLFSFLCDAKEITNRERLIAFLRNDPIFLSSIVNPTLDTLYGVFEVNRVHDKNNNLIIVY